MLEKELRANWDNVFYPEPEPEVETFGEEVQPVDDPVLLAAGPSGTVSDAGAAFGVFPQMKPRRAGASEVGANLPLLAADVAAGAGKGLVSGSVGLAGDVLAIGRGLYEIGRRGGDQSALDAFLQGMEKGLILPTSDDVDKWLTKNIGPVVPPGGPIQSAREGAAGVGRFAGEVVADPFVAIKGVKAAAKGAKALAPKAGEMADKYMGRMGLKLFAAPEDYRGSHRAPMRSDDVAAPGFDMTVIMPDDIYSAKAAQLYGHTGGNDPMDKNTARLIKMMRGKPDMDVMVFRAVPSDVKSADINRGDWITINRDYAEMHGESVLRGKYKIVSKMVKAKDIYTDGNSIHEWGYDPAPKGAQ